MCGIAGFVRAQEAGPEDLGRVRTMCDRLAHRGPDGDGYLQDGPCVLGHRRLSIIDVAGGAQPLGNEDGSIQVVFNGEIYNYRELREELLARGHRLHTASDTEVLVHLYEELGERMPERLNGMFAFALWDAPRRRLFLARDRFGEKPLYYSTQLPEMRLCFASEITALLDLPGIDRSVRPESVPEFLTSGYVADPHTIYRQIERLPPGCSLTVDEDGVRLRRYWSLEFAVDPGISFPQASERVTTLAQEAVRSRLMSEVPLGAFLSGGLDSSAIVTSMSELGREAGSPPVRTFSVGFETPELDERSYARLVAMRQQTEHHELVVGDDVEAMVDRCVAHYGEPFGDSSAIPTAYLADLTRRHVTVALSGDGADELFGGYSRYARALAGAVASLLPERFRSLTATAQWSFDHLPALFTGERAKSALNHAVVEHYDRWIATTDPQRLRQLLAPELSAALGDYTPRAALEERFARHRSLHPLLQMEAVELETYLPGDILVKMDRATMASSLESRAPWLDPALAEYSATLPPAFKLRDGIGKRVVRSAYQHRLPAETLSRRKMGFGPPIARWLRTSLRERFERTVFRKPMEAYLDLTAVRGFWQEHQSGANDHRVWMLWNIFMLACWDERFEPML